MGFDFIQLVNLPLWNRKIINGYWIIIGLAVLLSIFNNVISYFTKQYDSVPIITLGVVWVLGVAALEAANYWIKKGLDYIIITGAFIIPVSLIYSFPEDSVLLTTLYLPILISVLYFQLRKVIFSAILSLISFYALYLLCLSETALYSTNDLIIMTCVLLCGAIVAISVMSRGSELLKHLQTSLASSQDLLVKNVIMDKQIKTDALTGLYNHMSFHEYLDKLIEQGEKYNLSFQLAVLDIDHFKKVNDTFGHRAGDIVLKKVAQSITSMVSPNDFTARYGGEEFAVIFTDIELNESLLNLENIRTYISEQHHEELKGNAVTISIGVQDYVKGCTKEALFTGADQALYEAKRNGRNRTVVHDPQKETTNPN
ncbi:MULTISPECIES: GGDEF domain-containing protein [Paenibacillus]|uniref:GGDEF domain-containing protein n=1 Tax=Paenibacillus radicis (ex Xue et al. 2023) TaxID=2972489 RepID=A0ABT1YJP0_9BACL|nr:GGDEF domain-containing protein [Paenibacillus radicis (ex Xue et al. 2023)]MCR8633398.1 GGDEF domain-containing protein [Paenibacillus radicis (ex Xue et al. 2023)]